MSPSVLLNLQIPRVDAVIPLQLGERSASGCDHPRLEESVAEPRRSHIMAQRPGRIVRTVAATLDRSNLSALR